MVRDSFGMLVLAVKFWILADGIVNLSYPTQTSMAILDSAVLQGARGQIGKQLVFKRYGDRTIVTRYPDMSRVKRSRLQKASTALFKEAVAYAQSILRDEKKRKAFAKKLPRRKSIYHAAISEFMKKH